MTPADRTDILDADERTVCAFRDAPTELSLALSEAAARLGLGEIDARAPVALGQTRDRPAALAEVDGHELFAIDTGPGWWVAGRRLLPHGTWTQTQTLPHTPEPIDHTLVAGRIEALRTFFGLTSKALLLMIGLLVAWVMVPVIVLGWRPVVLASGSMGPDLPAGSVILSDPAIAGVGVGDVVTFIELDGDLVTHRVASVGPDGSVRTQGDANVGLDSHPRSRDSVRGVGRLVIPWLGVPLALAARREWFELALVVAAAWAVAYMASWTPSRTDRPFRAPGSWGTSMISGTAAAGLVAVLLTVTAISGANFLSASGSAGNSLTAAATFP